MRAGDYGHGKIDDISSSCVFSPTSTVFTPISTMSRQVFPVGAAEWKSTYPKFDESSLPSAAVPDKIVSFESLVPTWQRVNRDNVSRYRRYVEHGWNTENIQNERQDTKTFVVVDPFIRSKARSTPLD